MPTLEERVLALETKMAAMMLQKAVAQAGPIAAADASDLDGEHGNPIVRKDPPRWKGESCVGVPFSQCPPEFLDTLAGFLEWRAGKEEAEPEKQKYAVYSRKDCARARGWAARLRARTEQSEIPF